MTPFSFQAIEQMLVSQTQSLLSRIEATSRAVETNGDVQALMLLVDQVADNVSALTGDVIRDDHRDQVRAVEAEYLFSQPLELRQEAREAIYQQMIRFTEAIRQTLDPPKDEEFPF